MPQPPDYVPIPAPLWEQLHGYLMRRPFGEVEQLVVGMRRAAREMGTPAAAAQPQDTTDGDTLSRDQDEGGDVGGGGVAQGSDEPPRPVGLRAS